MHRLSSNFVLGYHGCDQTIGESLLAGLAFKPSENDYDWLGPGIYFWEANPCRGLEFAGELAARRPVSNSGEVITKPFVVGAVIELGLCLDLTTSSGLDWVRIAHKSLVQTNIAAKVPVLANSQDHLRRYLDCAVIKRLHSILEGQRLPPIDTVKGVFTEGAPLYPGSGFRQKTHIQIAVRNPRCIKGVFRVPVEQLGDM